MAGGKSYHSLVSEETNGGTYAWLKINVARLDVGWEGPGILKPPNPSCRESTELHLPLSGMNVSSSLPFRFKTKYLETCLTLVFMSLLDILTEVWGCICNDTKSLFIKVVLEVGKLPFLLLSCQPPTSNLIWPSIMIMQHSSLRLFTDGTALRLPERMLMSINYDVCHFVSLGNPTALSWR